MHRSRFTARVFLVVLGSGMAAANSPRALAGPDRGPDRFIRNTRQLTYDGRRSGECYFSPDGTKLVFMSEREPGNPFFTIYMLDFDTGDVTRISPGKGKATCPYFQAGTGLIEFASTHLDPDLDAKAAAEYEKRKQGTERYGGWNYDEFYDLFLAKQDGTIVQRLTDTPGYDAEGAFSPDGKLIVFCSIRDAYPPEKLSPEQQKLYAERPDYFAEIYLMKADGSEQRRLTDWPGYDGGPFFTPDGQRIVWRHFTEDGLRADVYTMKLDGSDRLRLTDFGALSWAPIFHPSGEYCIFTSNKLGFDNFELFLVDAHGRHEPVRVTYSDRFDGLPTFSPDGQRICWTSNLTDTNESQMFLADWDHAAALDAVAKSPVRSPGESREARAGAVEPTPVSAASKGDHP